MYSALEEAARQQQQSSTGTKRVPYHWQCYSSVRMLGQPIILLHDRDTIRDILTKSSKIASSRPSFTFADMCGFGGLLNLLSFNSTYLLHRKMIHKHFGTKLMAEHLKEAENLESHRFL